MFFTEYPSPVASKKSGTLNIPAISGIAACALVIFIASVIITCRKLKNKSGEEHLQEEFEECSSVTGSNRSSAAGRHIKSTGNSSYSTTPYSTGTPLSEAERDRLLVNANNEMFLHQHHQQQKGIGSMIHGIQPTTGFLPAGQAYVNWPVQHGQIIQPVQMVHAHHPSRPHSPITIQQLPQPAINYMIQQTQLNYNRKMSFDQHHSSEPNYEYPTSANEA